MSRGGGRSEKHCEHDRYGIPFVEVLFPARLTFPRLFFPCFGPNPADTPAFRKVPRLPLTMSLRVCDIAPRLLATPDNQQGSALKCT